MLKHLFTLNGHTDRVWSLAWNPTGTLLASSSSDKTIRIWKNENGEWVCRSVLEDGHSRTVRRVSFSPCGRYLVSASFDSTVIVWELKDGDFEVLSTLEGHENEVKAAAFSPSGRYLASCSRDKSVWVWEMDEEDDFQCCSILSNHSQDVKQVLWKHNEDVLVSVSYDNSVNFYVFDGDEWVLDRRLENAHDSTVWAACFNADDSFLATVGDDRRLKLWQRTLAADSAPKRWSCCATLSGCHDGPIYDVDWSVVNDKISTACGDNCIRVFSVRDSVKTDSAPAPNLTLLDTVYNAHDQDVNCVRWHPKIGSLLASCSDDELIKLWQYDEDEKCI